MRYAILVFCFNLTFAGNLYAQPPGDGKAASVRHSSASAEKRSSSRRNVARSSTRRTNSARRQGRRQGYRAGYRHGRYHGWHDARRSWRRWRTVTGLFRLGVYLATRPRVTTTVVATGTTYYYSGGVYYVSSGSGYVVVAPPPGAVVYSVPTYTTVVYSGTTEYLYVNGTYYVPTTKPAEQPPPGSVTTQSASSESQSTAAGSREDPSDIPMLENEGENYEVVAPPAGTTVPYLPEGADEKTVDGKRYYVFEGTYYQPFAGDGETIYMVVSDPAKA